MRFCRPLFFVLALALWVTASPATAAKKPAPEVLVSRGDEHSFYLHVPSGLDPARPVPLLVVLHGSGRDGWSLVSEWKKLADKEGFLVVGPNAVKPEVWLVPLDGPQFLHDLVEHVKERYAVDPRRIYLFGHSAGAKFTLLMAPLESRYFAAAALHAGAIIESDLWVLDRATRKIPIYIASGAKDSVVPIEDVRATRDALEARDFPVEMVEMPFHDHWYYDLAPKINRAAWDFLVRHPLEEDPEYEHHSFQ